MTEYSEIIETKDGYRVCVFTDKGKINFGIDIVCDGFTTELTKKELDAVINMLKQARKKIVRGD